MDWRYTLLSFEVGIGLVMPECLNPPPCYHQEMVVHVSFLWPSSFSRSNSSSLNLSMDFAGVS
jgi:hypothetical protein